jgi:hypothetical protein
MSKNETKPQTSEDIFINPNASIDDQIKAAELKSKLMELEFKAQEMALKTQELEAKKLEIQERTYHIKDLKTRIQDREIKDKQLQEDRQAQGQAMRQQDAIDKYQQNKCTHRKGGTASSRDITVLATGGNSNQYAVIKHQMINGDIWVRCLRCGKTWAPPVERNFFFDETKRSVSPADGVFDKNRFAAAVEDYKRAVMFETNNSMSTSVQCRFYTIDEVTGKQIDASDVYRDNIASTNLR